MNLSLNPIKLIKWKWILKTCNIHKATIYCCSTHKYELMNRVEAHAVRSHILWRVSTSRNPRWFSTFASWNMTPCKLSDRINEIFTFRVHSMHGQEYGKVEHTQNSSTTQKERVLLWCNATCLNLHRPLSFLYCENEVSDLCQSQLVHSSYLSHHCLLLSLLVMLLVSWPGR